jgi:hypothetical protein
MIRAMSRSRLLSSCVLAALSIMTSSTSLAGQLPSDVRSNHWAAGAVEQVLSSGVMKLEDDHQFHGEAHVTHIQAVIALAALAKKLETSNWKLGEIKPVPDKVEKTLTQAAWQAKPVTRYELASALARFGNYFAKAVTRPKPDAKDLGKSVILAANVKVPVQAGSPAYASYQYLAAGRMISPTSPLLRADNLPLKAAELSRGIAEAAAGVNDKLTEMGHDETGSTPDKSFHPKKPAPRRRIAN